MKKQKNPKARRMQASRRKKFIEGAGKANGLESLWRNIKYKKITIPSDKEQHVKLDISSLKVLSFQYINRKSQRIKNEMT